MGFPRNIFYRQKIVFVILDFHRLQQQVRHCVEVKATPLFYGTSFHQKSAVIIGYAKIIVTVGENPFGGIPIISIPQYFVFVNRKFCINLENFTSLWESA